MALQPLTIDDLKFLEGKQPLIFIRCWGSRALGFGVRVLTREGVETYNYTSNADRSLGSASFRLSQLPMSVVVWNLDAPIRRGELYVQVKMQFAGIPMILLSQGYVYDGRWLGWPPGVFEGMTDGPGLLRSVPGTDPAAGSEINETVPTNARWLLNAIRFTLVTDATVATRTVRVLVDDGSNIFYQCPGVVNQAASLTRYYTYLPGYTQVETAFDGYGVIRRPLPLNLMLFQGWRIRTTTANIQAGDNYGAPLLIMEEWIEE